MSPLRGLDYYWRLLPAYAFGARSQLSFWHETPEANHSQNLFHGLFLLSARLRRIKVHAPCQEATAKERA